MEPNHKNSIQARIAQLLAYQLGTEEVPGSNPGKGDNFSMKISNQILRIQGEPHSRTIQGIQLEGVPTSQKRQVFEAEVYKNL